MLIFWVCEERWHWNGRLKAICFYRISDKALASDLEVLTVQLGSPLYLLFLSINSAHSCTTSPYQYISPPMAPQRRNIPPNILTPSPPLPFLHDPPLFPPQPLSGCLPILPIVRRPDPAHNLHSPEGWVWRGRGCGLSEFEEGEEGVFGVVCWWGWGTAAGTGGT